MNAHEGNTAAAIAYLENIKRQFAATMDERFRAALDLLMNRARIHDQLRVSLEAILDGLDNSPPPLPIELINNARAWLQAHRDLENPKQATGR